MYNIYSVFCVLCVFLQLVKGIRYSITVEIGNTQCKKTAELSVSAVCEFVPEPHKLKVRCLLWEGSHPTPPSTLT